MLARTLMKCEHKFERYYCAISKEVTEKFFCKRCDLIKIQETICMRAMKPPKRRIYWQKSDYYRLGKQLKRCPPCRHQTKCTSVRK